MFYETHNYQIKHYYAAQCAVPERDAFEMFIKIITLFEFLFYEPYLTYFSDAYRSNFNRDLFECQKTILDRQCVKL